MEAIFLLGVPLIFFLMWRDGMLFPGRSTHRNDMTGQFNQEKWSPEMEGALHRKYWAAPPGKTIDGTCDEVLSLPAKD